MSTALLMVLGIHALGDFYLQNDKLAQDKQDKVFPLAKHALLYALAFVPLLFIAPWMMFGIVVFSHALLDTVKFLYQKFIKKTAVLFIVDQLCHIGVLAAVSGWYLPNFSLALDHVYVLKITVLLLWVAKPVSVMFIELFDRYRSTQATGTQGAGKVIGYLERLILAILLIVGEYGVIGWIIAAKTFARSKQLSDSQAFSEYFLVGTLISILSTLALFFVLFQW